MQLLDHVSITVRQLAHVQAFYEAIMQVLGACVAYRDVDAGQSRFKALVNFSDLV